MSRSDYENRNTIVTRIRDEVRKQIVPTKELYRMMDPQDTMYVRDPTKRISIADEIAARNKYKFEMKKTGGILKGIKDPTEDEKRQAIIDHNKMRLEKYCSYCKKVGHTIDACWTKNGNNQNFQRGRGRGGRTTTKAITFPPQSARVQIVQ